MRWVFAAATLLVVSAAAAQSPTPVPAADPKLCGAFPDNYKELVWAWLEPQLVDAKSAVVEWKAAPVASDLGRNGEHLYGWLVTFRVNSRNVFGGPTGFRTYRALIHDGQVVKGGGLAY